MMCTDPSDREPASLRQERERAEDEAVSAERSFAIRAAYDGIRTAFLSVLAEDAMVLGEGPEPGRKVYEALPKDHSGRLLWEPAVVAAAPDGTLAFTSGPYRLLDGGGQEKSAGVYSSVWRRHAVSGHLELVLDFGAKGAEFDAGSPELERLRPVPEGRESLECFLGECLEQGRCPAAEGGLQLGEPSPMASLRPSGCHCSRDGQLGVLWGARTRSDGSAGAFVVILGSGAAAPAVLASVGA